MALHKMLLRQLYTSHCIKQNNLGGIRSDKEHVYMTQVQKKCSVATFQPQRSSLGTKTSTVSAIIVHRNVEKLRTSIVACSFQVPKLYILSCYC